MNQNGVINRRKFSRFKVPGATVNYKQRIFYLFKEKKLEKLCHIEEISRAGIRFLSENNLEINSKITVKILIPKENFSQVFKGKVKWVSQISESNIKYKIGVQFNPYGIRKADNHPRALEKIIELENKFS